MGALHAGHLSLVEASKRENTATVVSIFVNPTQFNDPKDLANYPITIERDIEMLTEAGVDVLFLPSVTEMYPNEASKKMDYDLGFLNTVYEAAARPGHFDGVALVVKKLLDMVQPHRLYMGQKDYQQVQVVKQLIRDFSLPVRLVMCPIVREADGLAMSSRNVRLNTEARHAALELSKTLFALVANKGTKPLSELVANAKQALNLHPGINVEYLDIADADTLHPVDPDDGKISKVALLAATVGGVHLLDNTII
jgi:pantoate--beta-alanine ligase